VIYEIYKALDALLPDRMEPYHVLNDNPDNFNLLTQEDLDLAQLYAERGDRASAYLLLAEKTGNQVYLNTAQISSGSGPLVGGPAIHINAILQTEYSDIYPEISIEEFSNYILLQEIQSIRNRGEVQSDGTVLYNSPTELEAYEIADQAWRDVKEDLGIGVVDPVLQAIFPGRLFLAFHHLLTGDFNKAFEYTNGDVLTGIGIALGSELADFGIQFGITLGQAELIASDGGSSYSTTLFDEQIRIYTNSDGKIVGVFGELDGEPFDRDPGLGLATVPYSSESNDPFQYGTSNSYVLGYLLAGIGIDETNQDLQAIASTAIHDHYLKEYIDDIRLLLAPGGEITESREGDTNDLFISAINAVKEHGEQFGIESLVDKSTDEIVALALDMGDEGLAVRRALLQLTPYALVGADYSSVSEDLALYYEASGTGAITEQWLEHRSEMLSALIYDAKTDADDLVQTIGGNGDSWIYENRSDNQILEVQGYSDTPNSVHHVIFGSESGEVDIAGSGGDDFLFAAGGNDELSGGKGSDYLEGGRGLDTYIFIDDTLEDGALDIINDIDGDGILHLNGAPLDLSTLENTGANAWRTEGGQIQLTWAGAESGVGNLLIVIDQNGITNRIRIDNFQNGSFGITLPDFEDLVLPDITTSSTINGTSDDDNLSGTAANDAINGGGGNDSIDGLEGHDLIDAGAGDDGVDGGAGDDHIMGGDGEDSLLGNNGNDVIEGGAGFDWILGDAGDDMLFANAAEDFNTILDSDGVTPGTDNDWLNADVGNDLLVGSNGNNGLSGGEGNDRLYGGAGDDVLFGDQYWNASSTWSMTIEQNADGSISPVFVDAWTNTLGEPGPGGNDILIGDDYVEGDRGSDILDGGIGDDFIFDGGELFCNRRDSVTLRQGFSCSSSDLI
jgi:Ca2+-binding RTX toxin-like protein